jgi:hypothetical protein
MKTPRDPDALLAGLDQVDWSRTWDAYGKATQAPKHLRALASPDPAVQDKALDELSYTIYHQGSVYPAAAEAMPFLAELLRSARVPRKRPVLELVYLLACGQSYADNHAGISLFDDAVARDEKFARKLEAERQSVPLLHGRLREHVGTYLALLEDHDPETRLYAINLLAALPDLREHSLAPLAARARDDPGPEVRAGALIALAKVGGAQAEPALAQAITDEREPLARAAAVIWHVIVVKEKAGGGELDELHQLLETAPQDLKERYAALPCAGVFGEGSFDDDAGAALAAAGQTHAERALGVLNARLKSSRFLADATMTTLLYAAERAGGPLRGAQQLTPAQAEAVRIIAGVAWPTPKQTFVNGVDALRAFGLPHDPAAIRRLLGDPEPVTEPWRAAEARPKHWYAFWRRQ